MEESAQSRRHYKRLESLYLAAPTNEYYNPDVSISEGSAEISIDVSNKYFHSAQAVHGSVYFKLLDDAAFFAANSLELKFFVLTTSFTTYLTRPVSSGKMRAVGKVVNFNRSQFIAEAIVYNSDNKEIGRGSGIFVRSKKVLMQIEGYQD